MLYHAAFRQIVPLKLLGFQNRHERLALAFEKIKYLILFPVNVAMIVLRVRKIIRKKSRSTHLEKSEDPLTKIFDAEQ